MVFQKIKRFLISPRTVISLIIITLIACVIGFLVPQITDKSPSYFELWKEKNIYTFRIVDRLQLNRVYTSVWFLSLVVLITVSLGYSLCLQVKKNIRQGREHKARKKKHKPFSGPDRIMKIFKKRRYRLSGVYSDDQKLIFTKNSIGRWGGVIFHLGLLLVIISAIAVLCFQKSGFVQLMEGDLFDGKETGFLVKDRGVFAGEFNAGFKTHLSKLVHTYWDGGELKFLESSVRIIREPGITDKKISVNDPLFIDDTNIYQSNNYGYTLSFILKKPAGEEVLTHFNIDRAGDIKQPATGKSDFPLSPYIFKMKFLPDVTSKSFYLTKPILYLTVSEGGSVVFNGLIIPGNAVKIEEDILYFTGVRYWSGLLFVNNPGMSGAYIGFIIGIFGIAVMFLLPYKEIHLTLDTDTGLYGIAGMTKRYGAIFKEEMDEIKTEIVTGGIFRKEFQTNG
ncbi:MAG TPA: hypothetical protein ENH45_06080 [Nitrospirae bacterium]|nr:cytochrome c biogenesis protein Ccs1 [bacterium BMS3Abin10]GBE39159.1 cytochrome c biogenesis protein Ccs1 [bacterium BMS3Bbin08]HDZ84772.1 hypothetical protein [Nitrospirota bacterium]